MEPHRSITSSNPWYAAARSQATLLKNGAAAISKGDLSEEMQTQCIEVLNSLSDFLKELGRISSHPLIINEDLYNYAEKLQYVDPMIEQLWEEHSTFRKCCSIADVKMEENQGINPGIQALEDFSDPMPTSASSTPPIPSMPPLLRTKASIEKTLRELGQYAQKSPGTGRPQLDPGEVEKCRQIFEQVKTYIEPLKVIFECPQFKDRAFFNSVWTLMYLTKENDPTLESKVDLLFSAMNPSERVSRRGTPGGSTATSAYASKAATPLKSGQGEGASLLTNSPLKQAKLQARLAALADQQQDDKEGGASQPTIGGDPINPLKAPVGSYGLGNMLGCQCLIS